MRKDESLSLHQKQEVLVSESHDPSWPTTAHDAKREKAPLLTSGVKRIQFLGVPLDIVNEEDLPRAIEYLCRLKDSRQIVFLDFHEFMRVRWQKKRRKYLSQAALILPVSHHLLRGIKSLGIPTPLLQYPYSFVIKLLGILEKKNKSVYLLGSNLKSIGVAESTIRASFPGLQIVGRYAANFPQKREKDLITAIKKASPTLLLAGKGLKKNHLWLFHHRESFSPGMTLWEKRCYDVFSGKRGKPWEGRGANLIKGFLGSLWRPWRFLRIFRYIFFEMLLFFKRFHG